MSVSSSTAWKHLEVSRLSVLETTELRTQNGHQEGRPEGVLPDDPLEIGNNAFLLLYFPRILMDHQVPNEDHWNVPK